MRGLALVEHLHFEAVDAAVRCARIVAADNRLADLGDYDDTLLIELLQGLDGDLDGTGYTDNDLLALLDDDPDEEPEDAPVEEIPTVFGVVVECANEREQTDLLERLIAEGRTVRALT